MSFPTILLGIDAIVFIWSAVRPHDYFTWALEVMPVGIGFVILLATAKRFRFTNLVYGLMAVHALILMIGGHYTYAEVPFFNTLREGFHFSRNHFDRVGHFAQGFVPAMIAREILLRQHIVNRRGWLFFLVTC